MTQRKKHHIEIVKYRQTRFWAVAVDTHLLAVVVYKKGAEAIKRHLESLYNS